MFLDPHSDFHKEDNSRETKPSLRLLRSMSLNVETSAATVTTRFRCLASADDVTQLLLQRLGIMRRKLIERINR